MKIVNVMTNNLSTNEDDFDLDDFICDECDYHMCIVLKDDGEGITVRCNSCLNVTTMEFDEEE